MIQIKRLSSADAGFHAALEKLLAFEDAHDAAVDATVAGILTDIKKRGDEALKQAECDGVATVGATDRQRDGDSDTSGGCHPAE